MTRLRKSLAEGCERVDPVGRRAFSHARGRIFRRRQMVCRSRSWQMDGDLVAGQGAPQGDRAEARQRAAGHQSVALKVHGVRSGLQLV